MLRLIALGFILVFAVKAIAQTAAPLEAGCNCSESQIYCGKPYDSASLQLDTNFVICSEVVINLNGIYLRNWMPVVHLVREQSVLFAGERSSWYEIFAAKGKLKLVRYIETFDCNTSTSRNVSISSIKTVTYTISQAGKIDTQFIFPFRKLNVEQQKNTISNYNADVTRLTTDSTFYFNVNSHLSQLLIAALNGNRQAEAEIYKFDKLLDKTAMAGKIMRSYGTGHKELLQNSIRVLQFHRQSR